MSNTQEVTLEIVSNDGDTATAFCFEHNQMVYFNRGTKSKEQFMKDLAVGKRNKSRFIPFEQSTDPGALPD